jgi:hypothetical protein
MNFAMILVLTATMQMSLDRNERAVMEISTPDFLSPSLARPEIAGHYEFSNKMNPFYLCGNFDDIMGVECAVFLQRKQASGQVILVFLSSRWEPFTIYDSESLSGHASLQGWKICYWSTCGSDVRSGTQGYRKIKEIPYGKDSIILHYGGAADLWYWKDGKFNKAKWGE